jgi:predicted dehydrogenase
MDTHASDPGRRLRWGVLSTASIATQKVIPGLRRTARNEVVAIASRSADAANAAARDLGIGTAHPTYEALLADPAVEAVYVPLPNHLHAEWTIAAARAGKHVLCEKPLALDAEEAQRMIDAADSAGVVLMEAFMYRHHPSWSLAREVIASGRIGEVRAVDSWFSYYNDDPSNIRNVGAYGGGALYDIGCYAVNLSRMLFHGEPDEVQARVVRDPESGVDVLTSAILGFGQGTATFTCSTRVEDDQRVHVYGSRGRISIEIPFNIPPDRPTRVRVFAGGEPPVAPGVETFELPTQDPYAAELDAFAAAVLDGVPLPVAPTDAVANLRTIERIFAAAGA